MKLNQIFHPENEFFKTISRMVDLVGLSLLWMVCSIPLVTIGASTAALYVATLRCVRQEEGYTYAHFFQSLKKNFKQGILVTLCFLPVVCLFYYGLPVLQSMGSQGDRVAGVLFYTWQILIFFVLTYAGILCALLGRFTFPIGKLFQTALMLLLCHLPLAVLYGILLYLAVVLCFNFLWPIFFLPTLAVLWGSFPFEKMVGYHVHNHEE